MKYSHDWHTNYSGRRFGNFANEFGVSFHRPGAELAVCVCWLLCAMVPIYFRSLQPASKHTPHTDKGIESEDNYKYLETLTDNKLQNKQG